LFKKKEKKMAKNKTARAGDISFGKCQTLLPGIGEVIPNLIYFRFKLIGFFLPPHFGATHSLTVAVTSAATVMVMTMVKTTTKTYSAHHSKLLNLFGREEIAKF
jgi:hypothetical protein